MFLSSTLARLLELIDTCGMDGAKSAQSHATKKRLEQDARALFEKHGFAGVSAEQLTAQSGVTRGALYHHYAGKEGLFEAVVGTIMQEVHDRLASQAAGAADPIEALKRGVEAFFEVCTEPATHCPGAECRNPPNFSRKPPFLLRGLSYAGGLPWERSVSPWERLGKVDCWWRVSGSKCRDLIFD
jgi:AcrR family transcriptional regulator